MYGKVYSQIFDGTLHGSLEGSAVFMAMIALADSDGTVDLTLTALTNRTGWPVDFIKRGIELLEAIDLQSRSPDEEGRRIVRLRDNTDWGWRIVNYLKYRNIRDESARKEYMREYMRGYRSKQPVNKGKHRKPQLANAEAEAKKKEEAPSAVLPAGLDPKAWDRWVEYRRGIKKPLREVSMESAQKQMAALGEMQMAAVEHTEANGWTGLRAPDRKSHGGRGVVV